MIALDHLLSIVHSETPLDRKRLSLLDVGCGDGHLMALLHRMLARYRPGIELCVQGFDVSDSGVQWAGYLDATLQYLAHEIPEVDWRPAVRMLSSTEPWPYDDDTFDWVISNHVLEHVADHEFVFRETKRVLKPGGLSVHLFPVRGNLIEGHVGIPGSHWIRDHDRLRGYVRAMTRLGVGNFPQKHREDPTLDVERFAETRADYLTYFTNYPTKSEVLTLAKRVGLRCSFRYTEHFTFAKIREMLRMKPAHRIQPMRVPIVRALLFAMLSRLVSVTIVLEKKQTYSHPRSMA